MLHLYRSNQDNLILSWKNSLNNYTIDDYITDINSGGLEKTWHAILSKTLNGTFNSDLFNIDNYGELYEIGLEHVNKINKKERK